ncbi:MAG TPA: hypothetical protein VGM14_14405 [Streptosporangiaceae bacterium]
MPLLAFAVPALAETVVQQPPSAKPAMTGAQPRSRPVNPPLPGTMSILMHQLGGDAMFSAATFAVLLVPITGYGVFAKRREEREEQEAADRSEREAALADLPADPLLEFFAPLQPRPNDLPAAPSPRFQRPGLTGRSTMSASLGNRSPSAFTPSPQPSAPRERPSQERPSVAAPAAEGPAAGPQAIQVSGIGSDSVRRVEVEGTPPWEAASRPTTELPWAVISASGSARTPGTDPSAPASSAIPAPPDSVWDSAPASARRSSAPKSLFEPTSAPPPLPGQPAEAAPEQRQGPPAPASRSSQRREAAAERREAAAERRQGQPPSQRSGQPRDGATQPRQGQPPPPRSGQPREASTQPWQSPPPPPRSGQPRDGATQPRQGQPPPPRSGQPRDDGTKERRQGQPPSQGQSRQRHGQSRRGGGASTPPVPAPAPLPAPVPQPTSWQDLPGGDQGPVFVWNPTSDEYPGNDPAGDLPRRNRRSNR